MKINIQKLITSLYTSIEESENEVKKTLLFTITSKIIKYFEITNKVSVKFVYWKLKSTAGRN